MVPFNFKIEARLTRVVPTALIQFEMFKNLASPRTSRNEPAAAVLMAVAFGISVFLVFFVSKGAVAGCGERCGELASSRVGDLFGLPMVWFGVLLCAGTFFAIIRKPAHSDV